MNIGFFSLGGGQGKTTCAWMMHQLYPDNIIVDGDPQGTLTTVIGSDCDLSAVIDGTPPSGVRYGASPHLRGTNLLIERMKTPWLALRSRLGDRSAIIDMPPQSSGLTKALLGACDQVVIPFEANYKGLDSLVRSLNYLDNHASRPECPKILGIIPMRVHMYGVNYSKATKRVFDQVDLILEERGFEQFDSIVECDAYRTGFEFNQIDPRMNIFAFVAIGQAMGFRLPEPVSHPYWSKP